MSLEGCTFNLSPQMGLKFDWHLTADVLNKSDSFLTHERDAI